MAEYDEFLDGLTIFDLIYLKTADQIDSETYHEYCHRHAFDDVRM